MRATEREPTVPRTGHGTAGKRDRESGTALAELALVLALILTMMVAVFDLGRGFFAYLSVIQGARDGARAAMRDSISDGAIRQAAIDAAAPLSVTVSVSHSGAKTTVSVTHSFSPIIPLVSAFWGGGDLQMQSTLVSK